MWQADAAAFSIDGHAPVRELWHRGSLAWQHILTEGVKQEDGGNGGDGGQQQEGGGGGRRSCALVVAHNAVNQALLGTALGLPPRFFRRLLQSNGATSVLDFQPPQGPGAPVRVTVDRLNQVRGCEAVAEVVRAGVVYGFQLCSAVLDLPLPLHLSTKTPSFPLPPLLPPPPLPLSPHLLSSPPPHLNPHPTPPPPHRAQAPPSRLMVRGAAPHRA